MPCPNLTPDLLPASCTLLSTATRGTRSHGVGRVRLRSQVLRLRVQHMRRDQAGAGRLARYAQRQKRGNVTDNFDTPGARRGVLGGEGRVWGCIYGTT